jgi:hypothetical protein
MSAPDNRPKAFISEVERRTSEEIDAALSRIEPLLSARLRKGKALRLRGLAKILERRRFPASKSGSPRRFAVPTMVRAFIGWPALATRSFGPSMTKVRSGILLGSQILVMYVMFISCLLMESDRKQRLKKASFRYIVTSCAVGSVATAGVIIGCLFWFHPYTHGSHSELMINVAVSVIWLSLLSWAFIGWAWSAWQRRASA